MGGKFEIHRGDIFRIQVESGGLQTFLVVQNDIGNRYCQSIMAVPLTKNVRARKLFFTMLVEGTSVSGLEQDYAALFFLIRTLGKDKFTSESRLGRLDRKGVSMMDEILKLSLGLSALQQLEDRLNSRKTS